MHGPSDCALSHLFQEQFAASLFDLSMQYTADYCCLADADALLEGALPSCPKTNCPSWPYAALLPLPLLLLCCRYELPINPGFNITVALHDSHAVIPVANGMYDCKHYCHPGVPQVTLLRTCQLCTYVSLQQFCAIFSTLRLLSLVYIHGSV
jgi:hypothetical protein